MGLYEDAAHPPPGGGWLSTKVGETTFPSTEPVSLLLRRLYQTSEAPASKARPAQRGGGDTKPGQKGEARACSFQHQAAPTGR